jgi:hypothetical protein
VHEISKTYCDLDKRGNTLWVIQVAELTCPAARSAFGVSNAFVYVPRNDGKL